MVKGIPLVWLAASACTGCSVSLLNLANPSIKNILIDQVVPGVHINLGFHPTIMAGTEEQVIEALENTATEKKENYILVDGSIQMSDDGRYCVIEKWGSQPVTIGTRLEELSRDAVIILAMGNCAAFDGIPAATPNPTDCKSVQQVLKAKERG
ncbi:hypothetical protein ACFLX7_00300 [Chloroflexota bacterium]